MSIEAYRTPVMYMGRIGYALRHGYPVYAAQSAGSVLGASLGMALLAAAGIVLIVGAVSLAMAGKKEQKAE